MSDPLATDPRLRDLIVKGYFDGLQAWMKSVAAPLWWPRRDDGLLPFECGTVAFVRLNQHVLGITAAHVHRKVCSLRAAQPQLWCQLGAHTFKPEDALIDIDDELDIATYRISEIVLAATSGHAHEPTSWPPVLEEGDIVLPTGFPSALSTEGDRRADHTHLWFVCRAQVSGRDQIGAPSFTSTSVPVGGKGIPSDTDLYGMSGGPVFQLKENPLTYLNVAGIIHQYNRTLELFLIRPLTRVLADGTIDRSTRTEA